MTDRPAATDDDAHLREIRTSGGPVYDGSFLHVRRDLVALPNGHEASREYIVHNGAVVVVPILDDGRLVMERQWRHPVGRVLLEFPAGKIDPGEDTLVTGVRELLEETGYTAREWAYVCRIHNAAAYSTEFIEMWFARGLQKGEQRLDRDEFLEVLEVDEPTLDGLAAGGELTDAKTLIALLWLQKWRAGSWNLSWRAPPDISG